MFEVLVSSRVPRQGGGGRTMVSAAVHAALVTAAVRVTAQIPLDVEGPRVDAAVYLAPAPQLRAAPSEPVEGSAVVGAPTAVLPPAPVEMPHDLPPVTLGPALDPELLRKALLKGVAGVARPDGAGGPDGYAEAEVDVPAVIVSQPAPRYPPLLQAAQLEGRVVVEFIIDTAGRVERGSLRVVESSHPGFEAAAVEALGRSVFQPARIRGRPVRQRAVQAVRFRFGQGAGASAPVEVSLTRNTSVSP